MHVIPRIKFQASLAVPAVDYTPQIDRDKYEALVRTAEEFIVRRFLSRFPADSQTTPIVHIIKVRKRRAEMQAASGLPRGPDVLCPFEHCLLVLELPVKGASGGIQKTGMDLGSQHFRHLYTDDQPAEWVQTCNNNDLK